MEKDHPPLIILHSPAFYVTQQALSAHTTPIIHLRVLFMNTMNWSLQSSFPFWKSTVRTVKVKQQVSRYSRPILFAGISTCSISWTWNLAFFPSLLHGWPSTNIWIARDFHFCIDSFVPCRHYLRIERRTCYLLFLNGKNTLVSQMVAENITHFYNQLGHFCTTSLMPANS